MAVARDGVFRPEGRLELSRENGERRLEGAIALETEVDDDSGRGRLVETDPAGGLLSDERRRENRLAGIEAGAEALLLKPFDPDELMARVRVASRVSQYTSDLDSAASIFCTAPAPRPLSSASLSTS